jgi:hypothetical protein
MKRTVLRPPGPGIAAINAHPRTSRPSESRRAAPGKTPPDRPTDNRITLAVLEQHPGGRRDGYDPYNASASPMDIAAWKRRQKPG